MDDYKRKVSSPSLRIALESAGVKSKDVSSFDRDSKTQVDSSAEDTKSDPMAYKSHNFDLERALQSIRSSSKEVMEKESRFSPVKGKEQPAVSVVRAMCVSHEPALSEDKTNLIVSICDEKKSPFPGLDATRLELRPMTEDECEKACLFMMESESIIILPSMEKLAAEDGSFFWAYRICAARDIPKSAKAYPDGTPFVIDTINKGTLGGLVKDISTFGKDCWCDETSVVEGEVLDKSFIRGYSYIDINVKIKNCVIQDSICGQIDSEDGQDNHLLFLSSIVIDSEISGSASFKYCIMNEYESCFTGEKCIRISYDGDDVMPVGFKLK